MLPPLFRIETLLAPLNADALILTANQRLRSKALQAWGLYQQTQGIKAWPSPRLFSLEQWLQQCWQQLQAMGDKRFHRMILSNEQERVLWEQITADCGLMQPEILAKHAADGFRILERWQLPITALNNYCDADSHSEAQALKGTALYRQWCLRFEAQLQQHNLMTREQSYRMIGDAFANGILKKETSVHLVGFDDLPPLFQSQLEKAADRIISIDLQDYQPQSIVRISTNDSASEMQMASEWAKDILEKEPDSRIGIILPNLGQCRDDIERALINSFEGHSLLAETPRYTLPFNISTGTPLGHTPLIASALQILSLHHRQWPVDQLCQLLFSPFWGRLSEEHQQRHQLANRLQAKGVFDIELSELRTYAQTLAKDDEAHNLFSYFSGLVQHQLTHKGPYLPSEWVDLFLSQLDLMRWPGERRPDSQEYQQTQLWYQLLETFASLDSSLGLISTSQAIQQLQLMATHQPFQPKVPDSPIQVLGILEGAGLHFTHCWIAGLHQQAWPPAPTPNPLLPVPLQRAHAMPHASHLRELAFATSLTQQYQHCAAHIVFSAPEKETESEQTLVPSHLISAIPLVNPKPSQPHDTSTATAFSRYLTALYHSQQLQTLASHQAPPIATSELSDDGELRGGAGVLRAQAANPFDAFALYRLQAHNPPATVIGLSAIEQGNLLHSAMADIWGVLQNQATLLGTAHSDLRLLITQCLHKHLQALRKRKPIHLGETLCRLEVERQTEIIRQWLEYEKTRPDFQVIAIEETIPLTIEGITLQLRIDRIDQLVDGSLLIIDYKTGNASLSAWQGERLAEPQLPLYLLAQTTAAIAGIAFGQINIHKQTFMGLHDGEHALPGMIAIGDNRYNLPPNWQDTKALWEQQLHILLRQFLQGDCRVDYRDNLSKERNASLWPLNRYFDSTRLSNKIPC
jgi:probable DNA repair protein